MSKLLSNDTARWLQDLRKRNPPTQTRRTRTPFIGSGNGGGGAGVPCKVLSGNATIGFSVEVYADGAGKPSTDYGTIYILEVAASAVLSTGSWILGWPNKTLITGGSE